MSYAVQAMAAWWKVSLTELKLLDCWGVCCTGMCGDTLPCAAGHKKTSLLLLHVLLLDSLMSYTVRVINDTFPEFKTFVMFLFYAG